MSAAANCTVGSSESKFSSGELIDVDLYPKLKRAGLAHDEIERGFEPHPEFRS